MTDSTTLAAIARLESLARSTPSETTASAIRTALSALSTQAERIKELEGLINKPETGDFLLGVQIEAAHQVERGGAEHDTWAALAGDLDKAKHHTISTSAALANWHAQLSGKPTAMRPGVDATARGFDTIATPPAAPSLPADVVELVIAGREAQPLLIPAFDDEAKAAHRLDRALEAFSARVPYEDDPTVPAVADTAGEGWVLVPREPTDAMIDAPRRIILDDRMRANNGRTKAGVAIDIYRAMLSAVPATPEGPK